VTAAPAAASHTPSPGSVGIGDPLFPTLGNGGYDAKRYSLALRYPTTTPAQTVQGKVTMYARATQALSRFNLDFAGESLGSVSVNDRTASWTRDGDELVVTPKRALAKGRAFVVRSRTSWPNHPDWTVDPVDPGVQALRMAPAARRPTP
jgi:hypothetical protein